MANIGLDFDNTLVYNKAMEMASKSLGLNFTEEDITTWGHGQFPPELVKALYKNYDDPFIMCNPTPIKGAQDWVKKLHLAGHNLYCLTSRQPNVHSCTIETVFRLFPEIIGVCFTNKVEFMLEKGIKYFVDDGPHHIQDSISNGIKSFLILNNKTRYNWEFIKDHASNKLLEIYGSVADIQLRSFDSV